MVATGAQPAREPKRCHMCATPLTKTERNKVSRSHYGDFVYTVFCSKKCELAYIERALDRYFRITE